ncbi:hypothetical protein SCHPADRAFT_886172 [Schizopora paradoxa]|uniref:Uncharacterized protein n=1 Tax=Schizopora paradoxa TaxID=27342 RepID=A0A0H2S3D2_9AGAM|nr:hypothetical protein SCHPADRAFT_886172 [Schizopora paradoxa]
MSSIREIADVQLEETRTKGMAMVVEACAFRLLPIVSIALRPRPLMKLIPSQHHVDLFYVSLSARGEDELAQDVLRLPQDDASSPIHDDGDKMTPRSRALASLLVHDDDDNAPSTYIVGNSSKANMEVKGGKAHYERKGKRTEDDDGAMTVENSNAELEKEISDDGKFNDNDETACTVAKIASRILDGATAPGRDSATSSFYEAMAILGAGIRMILPTVILTKIPSFVNGLKRCMPSFQSETHTRQITKAFLIPIASSVRENGRA